MTPTTSNHTQYSGLRVGLSWSQDYATDLVRHQARNYIILKPLSPFAPQPNQNLLDYSDSFTTIVLLVIGTILLTIGMKPTY